MKASRFLVCGCFVLLSLVCGSALAAESARLTLEPGDHIAIVGNTLPDRMQHFGYLESLLHDRFPDHKLVVRNLGFSGDELDLRLRSQGFGSPDDHLRFAEADTVLAFFGYNESFAGREGLDKFKSELAEFVKHLRSQEYNGESAPQVVLFAPIAHEKLADRNLSDGQENNERLRMYSEAMAEVAAEQGVAWVDLFGATTEQYASDDEPLTFNGIHLNDHGNEQVARIIDRALFGENPDPLSPEQFEKLRQAVLDKNFHWWSRYRTTDGYSIFGGRADLKFVDDQTNRVVMQRELEILNEMTQNRDRRIWAIAGGGDLEVDDSNTQHFIEVITNKPGPLPGGKHIALGGEEAIEKMTVAKNMKVNLVASEEMFPELINPVQMAFDTKGRLWVAAWDSYPHWKPKDKLDDKLLILVDTDGDGQADKCKTFAGGLHNPTGFEFWGKGVFVAQAPDLLYLEDTDGDDVADVRRRVISGLDSADTHHTSNSFTFDPGGALYFQEGTFHHSQVETPYGPPVRLANAGVFRYVPRTQDFGVYVSYGFANPHGHVFDRWGQDIVIDGTGAVPYHGALFSGHVDFPNKHPRPPTVYQQRTRPCPGMEVLSSKHFPEEMQDNLLVGNVIGFQGILRYKVEDKGASFTAVEQEPVVSSTDPSFRPADFEIGPDGAIYFVDWYNPIIGHMQHNLRDPSRDRTHGRVYRITYEGRPLSDPPAIAGEPIDKLLDVLKQEESRVRYRARIELAGRDSDAVVEGLERWVAGLDKEDPDYQHHLLEALWVYQHHNRVNQELLEHLLSSPDFRARAAATRVLCYWRDRVPSALELLRKQAADEHPRVRLEAVRAASFFTAPEAMEIVLIADEHPQDEYLKYVRGETVKTLDRHFRKAIDEGYEIAFVTDAGRQYLLHNIRNDKLLAMDLDREVAREILRRPGILDVQRSAAIAKLADLEGTTELDVIMGAINELDKAPDEADPSLVFDLVRLLTSRPADELAGARVRLEKLATAAKQPVLRQIGYVSLMNVDKSPDKAWELAGESIGSLRDFVMAMPLVADGSLRASLYERIVPLVDGLPAELASRAPESVDGRYVRIELPKRRGTLTLAEVEVESGGQNVARSGKASQKNTAHGGDASRAIDGNTSGTYSDGSQTHTAERTENPWWEVDLGAQMPIEAITVFNRTDGYLGKRLNNFTVSVLDADREEVFRQEKIEAPRESVTLEVSGGDPAAAVRRAAMTALTYVRGKEAETFALLAPRVADDQDRAAAIRALQRLRRADWPQELAEPLLSDVQAYLSKLPVEQRTTTDALSAMEFAHALTSLLPADQARQARARLNDLGVRVIRVGTLFERMSYDKETIPVRAGKPVEFVFENSDLMPHNFVIVKPGTMEEIGQSAEATAQQPDAAARHFVPESAAVLLSSKLLQPRESQKLSFTAPSEPGVYPYVCTYPGHWRRMYGALYVVEDLDAYLEDPEAYLASHPLEVKDELLKDRRPRTEWKFDDLASAVGTLEHGRSFGNGKQLFEVAGCVACHKLNGAGNAIGPDLSKLDEKMKSLDILKELLDPSARINEKFQSYIFQLDSGRVVTGLVLEETPAVIKVAENPLAKANPSEFKPEEVEQRVKSPTSIMPKGLLDRLSREEILDLIAYVLARGNAESALFHGAGHAGHH
ncbi:MAG: dehydrogenase [Planctomycetota bacterium]|mgnify:CR=1 FL=1|nr:MAG: dehydrogenase [Planctomycetota bacterium]